MTDPRFPRGRLNEDDEGALKTAIGIEDNCVKIVFSHPCAWFAFEPDKAIDFANTIIRYAAEIKAKAH